MMDLSSETYQKAIIIPINVWDNITKRLVDVENASKKQTETEETEVFYTTTEAAHMLGMHVLSLGRARKEGRIKGKAKNGREMLYSNFEIANYQKRYPRYK